MVYAYDRAIPLPVQDLYDTLVMAMSINAAKDMYERGLKLIDDFYNKYGDFVSPFAKDMERYGQIVGGLRDVVNQAYANGVDPLRSAEGRALVALAIRSVNPAEINAMRANAKTGYAYLDALQALRRAGKYSQAQEDFDIAQTGGPQFADFATSNGAGGFAQWDRVSPIQATTLGELTYDYYKGRTPRILTKQDFENDPRLKGKYQYDPRYEWTGYLYSDLMKNAPGASKALAADSRAAFFRELARQEVIAKGYEPTDELVEAQFRADIADANKWALVDPTRKADAFALADQAHRNSQANIYLQNRLARERENDRYQNQIKLQILKNEGKGASKYKSLGGGQLGGNVYHVTEEVHHDGIYNQLKNLGIKVPKLTIKNGKILRLVDKSGKQIYIDVDDASAEELRYAAAHKNELLRAVTNKMRSLLTKSKLGKDYITDLTTQNDFVDTFGYKISAEEAKAFYKDKKLSENGGILLSGNDLRKMQSVSSIMAGTFNSGSKQNDEGRLKTILGYYLENTNKGADALDRLNSNKSVDTLWIFDSTAPKNIILRPNKDGGTETFLKGTARIKWGDLPGDIIEVEQWLPIGLVSEKAVNAKGQIKASDFELRGENRAGYRGIDAGYMKETGSQKQANPALTDMEGDYGIEDLTNEQLLELLGATQ